MHMPDHGYRPAYSGQFASDPQTQVIVAVDLDTTGSDAGLMAPMQDRIAETYGQTPHSTWLMAVSANSMTSNGRILPASRCLRRRRTTSTGRTRLPRARVMVPGRRHGVSGWRARQARWCIATAPSTSASMRSCAIVAWCVCWSAVGRKCGRYCCGSRCRIICAVPWRCAARLPSRSPRPLGEVCPTPGGVQPGRELAPGKPETRAISRHLATVAPTPGFRLSPRRSRPRSTQTVCFTASRGEGVDGFCWRPFTPNPLPDGFCCGTPHAKPLPAKGEGGRGWHLWLTRHSVSEMLCRPRSYCCGVSDGRRIVAPGQRPAPYACGPPTMGSWEGAGGRGLKQTAGGSGEPRRTRCASTCWPGWPRLGRPW